MGIKEQLFKWFKTKDKNGKELNVGYVLDGEPKTMEDIEKLFNAFGLESKLPLFKELIRSKIGINLSANSNIEIGRSKIGGNPDLPLGTSWPTNNLNRSLSFIGQINCSEVTNYDESKLLPSNGLLSFFYCADQEAWGFDPNDADRFKIIYSDSTENLKRHEFPHDLDEHSKFRCAKAKFESSLSLPGWEHESIDGFLTDEEADSYIDISCGVDHQMLGYADCVQGPMELECQLVTNGLYCGDPSGYEDPRRKHLEAGKEDWLLLLQVDSDEDNTGMMWGDVGKLYFWIRKQDLQARNFEKAWFNLQCH